MTSQDLNKSRQFWDEQAATFDKEADHGLRDPLAYEAWRDLLSANLPSGPQSILDIGCGTGSLSVLLSRLGHHVSGIDLSPKMVAIARQKAATAEQEIDFSVMDAADPPLAGPFDVIVCRHLLWALPDPSKVLERWTSLLRPAGRLMLIEGYWNNAGLHADELIQALADSTHHELHHLSDRPELWGKPVDDERYLLVATTG